MLNLISTLTLTFVSEKKLLPKEREETWTFKKEKHPPNTNPNRPILPFWSNLRLGGEHLSPELESDQFRLTTANVCGKIRKIGEKCGLAIGCLRHLGTA